MVIMRYGHRTLCSARASVSSFESAKAVVFGLRKKFPNRQKLGWLDVWYCQIPQIAPSELDLWRSGGVCQVQTTLSSYNRELAEAVLGLALDAQSLTFNGPETEPYRTPNYWLTAGSGPKGKYFFVTANEPPLMHQLLRAIESAKLIDGLTISGNSALYSVADISPDFEICTTGSRMWANGDEVPLGISFRKIAGEHLCLPAVIEFASTLDMPMTFSVLAQLHPENYTREAEILNGMHRVWHSSFWGVKVGELVRHSKEGLSNRIPLLAQYKRDDWYSHDIPELQIDFVRDDSGSVFIELQTVKGIEFLRSVAETIPLKFEEWDGDFCGRWDRPTHSSSKLIP